jgi:methylenetetrahydrofolate dehydrogenase (NADP+)/methenyltetrahydrofolate cyclohydrolase
MLLKGDVVVAEIEEGLKSKIAELKKHDVFPTMALVRVGERFSDIAYEASIIRACEALDIQTRMFRFASDVRQVKLIDCIRAINEDDEIHGALVFMPLPKNLDEDAVRNALDPRKDLDGISDGALAGMIAEKYKGYPPCTAVGCIDMLNHYGIKIEGKRAVVIGRSKVIGKPVSLLLTANNATVTVCHTRTPEEDVRKYCSDADIIIVATGRPGTFRADMASKQQVILDVGINVMPDGSLTGDVAFEQVKEKVAAITPVPGGVGGVTTAVLMKHLVMAAEAFAVTKPGFNL